MSKWESYKNNFDHAKVGEYEVIEDRKSVV